jgi:hypothetical protein
MARQARLAKLSLWFIGGAVALLANVTQPRASDDPLFLPQYDLSIRDASLPAKPGGPPPYSATRSKATWSVVAWGIPGGPLPAFSETREGGGSVFSSRTASASVVIKQQGNEQAEYELSQDGAILPCNTANGHPAEFDLFLHPNDKANALEQRGYTATEAFKDGLDALSAVTLQTLLRFTYKDVDRPDECSVSSGNAVAGFILRNPSAKQTLFYDVVLASACGKQPAKRQAHCEQYLSKPWSLYFSKKTPFGVDDPAPLQGMPFLKNGESKDIRLNVLPGLLAAIAQGPDGMDHDPSHWRLQGFLNGQVIYGGMKITTTWSHLTVSAGRK